MTVRTLFFASYRDIAGADELELDVVPGVTVRELVATLRRRGGSWSRFPESPVVAVNQEYSSLTTPLSEGDEVAFIPPVSGG